MYKAIQVKTGEEIIILSPAWRGRIEELRAMDHADLLVCQGCHQPLRVKAGEMKRPHFAHKHLKACSYGKESLEILNARAVLYDLLLKWFTPAFSQDVTLEKALDDLGLPRPVDCWVETAQGPVAYWIIESGIKLEPREVIQAGFARLGVKVHYIFLHTMLNEEKKAFHSLLLTPTERAFMQQTVFDEPLAGRGEVGATLHYLDAERQILTTYRGLLLFHRPNWFKGLKKTSSLDEVRVNRRDGDLIHPGETERLGTFRRKKGRLESKLSQARERTGPSGFDESTTSSTPNPPVEIWGRGSAPVRQANYSRPEVLKCAICGQLTDDYWSSFIDTSGQRLCRCRACLDREDQGTT